MCCIETFIILTMTALYLPVVSGRIRADQFVLNPMFLKPELEQSGFVSLRSKAISEFRAVICLHALNRDRKCLNKVFQKLGRIVCIMLLKRLHKTPSGILVNGSILIEFLANDPGIFQTGRRNELHIDLDPLSRALHLFVRLWNVFRVRWMNCHNALFTKETI